MLKTVFASMMAIAATLALSVGAAADASVQHLNLNSPEQCVTYTYKGNYTFCYSSTGEANMVQTPSGNWSSEINGTFSSSVSQNGTLLFSSTSAIHAHALYSASLGVLKEDGLHITGTDSFGGVTCTYSMDLHLTDFNFATGTAHIQYYNRTVVCA